MDIPRDVGPWPVDRAANIRHCKNRQYHRVIPEAVACGAITLGMTAVCPDMLYWSSLGVECNWCVCESERKEEATG